MGIRRYPTATQRESSNQTNPTSFPTSLHTFDRSVEYHASCESFNDLSAITSRLCHSRVSVSEKLANIPMSRMPRLDTHTHRRSHPPTSRRPGAPSPYIGSEATPKPPRIVPFSRIALRDSRLLLEPAYLSRKYVIPKFARDRPRIVGFDVED